MLEKEKQTGSDKEGRAIVDEVFGDGLMEEVMLE